MKGAFRVFFFLILAVAIGSIVSCNVADNEYSQNVGSFWSLSVKASTLDAKAQYLDRYVAAVQSSSHTAYNAQIFQNPDNDWQQNMNALVSLQQRMHEIKNMDVTSFQYQQAIAQITAQEQGEASRMLDVFEGCWFLQNHTLFWDWHCLLMWVGFFVALLFTGFLAFSDYYDYH